MTASDLQQIVGFLEENEDQFISYLQKGAGGETTKRRAEQQAADIIQRAQDFSTDSLWADYLTEQTDD